MSEVYDRLAGQLARALNVVGLEQVQYSLRRIVKMFVGIVNLDLGVDDPDLRLLGYIVWMQDPDSFRTCDASLYGDGHLGETAVPLDSSKSCAIDLATTIGHGMLAVRLSSCVTR